MLLYRKSLLNGQQGQSLTEVLVVVCLLAVAGILGFMLFGDNIRKQFGKSGRALGGHDTETVGKTDGNLDVAKHRDLKNFTDGLSGPETPEQPPPPASMALSSEMFHLGDHRPEYTGTWSNDFEITGDMSMVSTAQLAISFSGDIPSGTWQLNSVHCENPIFVNGHEVGRTQRGVHGEYTFSIDTSWLNEGYNNVTIRSPYGDDFDVDYVTLNLNSSL